jgi:hypothetical protein
VVVVAAPPTTLAVPAPSPDSGGASTTLVVGCVVGGAALVGVGAILYQFLHTGSLSVVPAASSSRAMKAEYTLFKKVKL